jgi:hypothetical protein
MSDQRTVRRQAAEGHGALRTLAIVAVATGVLLLAAAAFALSYAGIHLVALSAGVSPRLARLYPLIFDAMLVVAGAAVLGLRGGGLPSRTYAWLSMLVLLAAAAGADTLHATGTRLPRKPAAASAAIIPWALVLIGFGLLLCLLRQARLRKATAAAPQQPIVEPSGHVELRPGLNDLLGPKSVAQPPAQPQVTTTPTAPTAPAALRAPAIPTAPAIPAQAGPPTGNQVLPPAPAPAAQHPSEPATQQTSEPAGPQAPEPSQPQAPQPPAPRIPEPSPATEDPVPPQGTDQAEPAVDSFADTADDLAIDTEPGQDDPATDEGRVIDEGHVIESPSAAWRPSPREEQPASNSATGFSAAPTMAPEDTEDTEAQATDGEGRADADGEPRAEAGRDTDSEPEPESAADSAPAVIPAPAEEPAPVVVPQFDRKRSSPVPPQA